MVAVVQQEVAAFAVVLEAEVLAAAADFHMGQVNSQGLYTHLLIIQKPRIKWVGIMGAGVQAPTGHGPMQDAVVQVQ